MTRPRSNALYGPSDPRWRSATELDFAGKLNEPVVMHDSLKAFLRKIYAKADLMAAPDSLADKIYDLYSGSGPGANGASPAYKESKQFIRALWHNVKSDPTLMEGYLQYEKVSLQELFKFIEAGNRPRDKFLEDFIYFKVSNEQPGCRVYANAKLTHAPNVVAWLKNWKNTNSGLTAFKVVGPMAIAGRNDAIVCYCTTTAKAKALGSQLVKLKSHFNIELPEMTTPIGDGLGVAIGAEPEWQATGMGGLIEGYPESAQSFGTIRSQLIAAAIYNYNDNKAIYGDNFESFTKFVSVAFKGYGLNPAQPGD